MIMGAQKLDYKKMCRLPFGENMQVHEDKQLTNTVEPQTLGAINLGPTGYILGGHHFLNLGLVML